jgi:FAD/FMN-containing dehydrogenase
VCDDGLVLDLSAMKTVLVDPIARTVTAGAGLTLGELDAATARHGLATPTGIVSVTGLSGLALGGGLGWLNGVHGLTCDNIISVEIVTADGELLTASDDEHPDLFWAIRGGGGNFGLVTSFTLRLHPVSTVLAGGLSFSAAKAHDALAAYHRLTATSPDELSANASIWRGPEGAVGATVAFCHSGDAGIIDNLLRELRAIGPDTEAIKRTPYVDLQRAADGGFPEGRHHYWKSASLSDLGDAAIANLLDHVAEMPSPASGVALQRLHGAAARVAATATAYPHRQPRYDLLILSQWDGASGDAPNIDWTRRCFAAVEPFLDPAVYVNNLGDEGDLRVRQAYGPNYERLVAVKSVYDPTNLFRHNHNIPPRRPPWPAPHA